MDIWDSFKSLSILMTKKRLLLHVLMVCVLIEECHLGWQCPCHISTLYDNQIFFYFIEDIMEVFMDDFSVYQPMTDA